MSSDLRKHWSLDPEITFLNHGSFGATPIAVLQKQSELRAQLESEPVRFFLRQAPELWHAAVERAAQFVGADARGFVFVANATTGVNTVLSSLELAPGDELVVTDHEYDACRNALNRVAERTGARVSVATLPFPVASPQGVVDAVIAAFTERTRLLLIDHVTSQTGLVLPIAQIADHCRTRGIEILIDGAHAPGMLDLDVASLGVDYYTGNFHKWVCTPKTAAFLWIAEEHRDDVRPVVTSHGANMPADEPWQRLRNEFDWVGTIDPTPVMSIPFGLDHMEGLVAGGWAEVRDRNHALVVAGRRLVCDAVGSEELAPESMLGSLASIRLPVGATTPHKPPLYLDPLQDVLLFDHRIEVPVTPWPKPPHRLMRISAQLYNDLDDFERLAEILPSALA